jgi:hypothetical protein
VTIRDVLEGCVSFLDTVYWESQGLFPYSTSLRNGSFVNDFEHPQTLRYTINSLLGLLEASHARLVDAATVERMIETFVHRQYASITSPADQGLASLLLCENGVAHHNDLVREGLRGLRTAVERASPASLNMQDLSWIVWGSIAAARHGVPDAEPVARTTFNLIRERFVDNTSGLPRHSTRAYRRNIVSFGSIVYFLRAAYEYARYFEDEAAYSLFRRGVERALAVQGPRGEWPWMIEVRTGNPVDFYPVFSVHQDSMALLFLFAARDAGLAVDDAVTRSWRWVLGNNELETPMFLTQPFFAYRSIERVEKFPRAHRYVRALTRPLLGRPAPPPGGARVRINPECRSYHLGWILYVWSRRQHLAAGLAV